MPLSSSGRQTRPLFFAGTGPGGIAGAQKESLAEVMDASVATRADLASVKADLKAEIAASKSELKAEIAAIRADMQAMEMRLTIKLGALMVVAVGMIATLMKH